jgi:ATP-dependent DNA helicase RecQ
LTYSNSDATQLAGMLKQRGIPAKLIQSNDRFDLLKMRESRFLFKQLGAEDGHRTITNEQLETVERKLKDQFGSTVSSEILIKAIRTFRKLHPKTKYRSDLEMFLQESRLEDFFESDRDTIIVSTMHKAKGREFDNIYLMLNHYIPDDDAKKRLLYVAMTRAKSMLEIHYNDDYLDHIQSENIIRLTTDQNYPKPAGLLIQLTHKDIQLGYFGFIQRRIFPLNSGDELGVNEEGCVNKKGELVLKFSAHMREELNKLSNEGYKPVEAHVVFIVNWYSEEKGEEYLLVLPELKLERVE